MAADNIMASEQASFVVTSIVCVRNTHNLQLEVTAVKMRPWIYRTFLCYILIRPTLLLCLLRHWIFS